MFNWCYSTDIRERCAYVCSHVHMLVCLDPGVAFASVCGGWLWLSSSTTFHLVFLRQSSLTQYWLARRACKILLSLPRLVLVLQVCAGTLGFHMCARHWAQVFLFVRQALFPLSFPQILTPNFWEHQYTMNCRGWGLCKLLTRHDFVDWSKLWLSGWQQQKHLEPPYFHWWGPFVLLPYSENSLIHHNLCCN